MDGSSLVLPRVTLLVVWDFPQTLADFDGSSNFPDPWPPGTGCSSRLGFSTLGPAIKVVAQCPPQSSRARCVGSCLAKGAEVQTTRAGFPLEWAPDFAPNNFERQMQRNARNGV
jgi:hypothetical protein